MVIAGNYGDLEAREELRPAEIWSQMMPGWSALPRLEPYDAVHAQLGFGTKREDL